MDSPMGQWEGDSLRGTCSLQDPVLLCPSELSGFAELEQAPTSTDFFFNSESQIYIKNNMYYGVGFLNVCEFHLKAL